MASVDVGVGLLGYGTVGTAVARMLSESGDEIERATGHRLRVVRALVRDPGKERSFAPGDGVRGRPYPDLILTALMRLEADSVFNVAALGDTTSDIESALRAGVAIAAGTLTGAHDDRQLRDAGATHVVGSITDFAELILQNR